MVATSMQYVAAIADNNFILFYFSIGRQHLALVGFICLTTK